MGKRVRSNGARLSCSPHRFMRVWSEGSEPTRLDNSPHVWPWQGAGIDVRGKVPAWVEADLDRGIAIGRSFQHVEQPVDTERVPIAQRGRSASPVPRPQRLSRANLNQQPPPPSRAEAPRAEQKPIVRQTVRSPQRAFPCERGPQGITLPRQLQTEGSCFGEGDDVAGVIEDGEEAGRVLGDTARADMLGWGRGLGDGAVTGNYEGGEHQRFRPGDPDTHTNRRQLHRTITPDRDASLCTSIAVRFERNIVDGCLMPPAFSTDWCAP